MNTSTIVPQCTVVGPGGTWHPSFTNRAATISSIFAVVVQCFMIPFVMVFNTITLLLVAKFKDLHKPQFVALCLVSITDFFSGVVAQPLFAAKELYHFLKQQVSCELDRAFYLSGFALSSTSFYQLVILTYERYVGITDPLHYPYRITLSKLLGAVAINWLIHFIIIVTYGKLPSEENNLFIVASTFAIMCLFSILYWYIKIFHVMKKHHKAILAQQQSAPARESSLGQHVAKQKYTKTAAYLVVGFGLNYCPIIISTFLEVFYGSNIRGPLFFAIQPWVVICVHSNSLFSPLFYGFRTSEFRKFARQLFGLPPANNAASQALEMQTLPHFKFSSDEAYLKSDLN